MFSLPAFPIGLFRALDSLPLQPWSKARDHGILLTGALLGFIVFYVARYLASPYRKLPPGPRGYPIIGNLFELGEGQWLRFTELQKKYGDLIYLNAASQPIIVVNSQRAAVDLFDRRAAIYSDRPQSIVACDIMTGGLFFPLSRYGDIWRRMRKAADEKFTRGLVKGFHEKETTEAVLLAHGWLFAPAKWDQHLRRASASMILSAVYGYPTITSEQDPTVEAINDFSKRLTSAALPGAHLVEFFPWMRHVPSSLAKWKREAEAAYTKDSAMFEGYLRTVETNVENEDDYQSLGATLIREVERNKLSARERSWVAGTMYVGGAETVSAMMAWWTLAMLVYPETQARAQAELDAVVGRERLPTFADYSFLPYIRAMVKEVLRWKPVTPLGGPHRCTEDDWYEGVFIPKGAICLPNVWYMNRDPEIYGENASHFEPARHLDANGDIAPGPSDAKEKGHATYGFGRRICIGRYVADDSLFINMAVLLWATKIERKKDAMGLLLPLDVDGYEDHGLIVRPVPFECEISPRFPEAPALLAQERELREL